MALFKNVKYVLLRKIHVYAVLAFGNEERNAQLQIIHLIFDTSIGLFTVGDKAIMRIVFPH